MKKISIYIIPVVLFILFFLLFNKRKKNEVFDILDESNTSKFTISHDEAKQYADDLEEAFNDIKLLSFENTDLESIRSIISNINSYDLGLIHHYFSLRKYFLTGTGVFNGTPLDLIGWFNEELSKSSDLYITIKMMYQKINKTM